MKAQTKRKLAFLGGFAVYQQWQLIFLHCIEDRVYMFDIGDSGVRIRRRTGRI